MYVCVCVCIHCDQKALVPSGAGITGHCESPDVSHVTWVLRIKPGTFWRVIHALKHDVSSPAWANLRRQVQGGGISVTVVCYV